MIKKNIEIRINSKTRQVFFDDNFLGIQGENLQGYLIFQFEDEFVDGVPVVKVKQGEEKYNIYEVVKENNTYKMIIKSSLLKTNSIYLQLVITENDTEEGIPKFISKDFYMYIGDVIETDKEIPQEYSAWIDIANSKLIEFEKGLEEIETQSAYAKEQGDYAKQEAEKVVNVVDYVVTTSDEANDKSDTAISIAKGANQALDYLNYESMITNFNAFEKEKFMTGQQIMIKKLNVPDVWIYQLTNEYVPYTYTTDEEVINLLLSDNGFHVGYYVLSALETQKVDLTEYVKNTDYATSAKAGVIKSEGSFGILTDSAGRLYINPATTSEIDAKTNKRKPIVPENLEYAVKSIGDNYYAKTDDLPKVSYTYGIYKTTGGILYIDRATEGAIDSRTSDYKPIVPSNLEYAVKSVVGGHVTLTQAQYDALETKDENTYYNIVEE